MKLTRIKRHYTFYFNQAEVKFEPKELDSNPRSIQIPLYPVIFCLYFLPDEILTKIKVRIKPVSFVIVSKKVQERFFMYISRPFVGVKYCCLAK